MTLPGPDQVHRFWFGEVDDWADCARRNNERWFSKGRELDAEVSDRFAALIEAAGRGEKQDWLGSPRGALALVITLDQFPRHIFRGTAAAFDLDRTARTACEAGIARGHDHALSPVERTFFYLPLEHAEDPEAQERSVSLMEAAAVGCEPALAGFMEEAAHYARLHRDIIARFGRFPHRNAVLGRTPTREEAAWLEQGGATFGQ